MPGFSPQLQGRRDLGGVEGDGSPGTWVLWEGSGGQGVRAGELGLGSLGGEWGSGVRTRWGLSLLFTAPL